MSDTDYDWANRLLDKAQEENFEGRPFKPEELLAIALVALNRADDAVRPAMSRLRAIEYAMGEQS